MTYSQFDEDSIIDFLVGTLPDGGVIVDIGAGDGMEISNSRLFRERGWFTVLAESDPRHIQALKELEGPSCSLWLGEVTPENLSEVLHPDTDVLSIDVDGDDIFLLESLEQFPLVIVVEHNPTIPYNLDVMPTRRGLRVGSSVRALMRVARSKGYGLAAVTHCNAIFQHGIRDIPLPKYRPSYVIATEYFTGRPFVLGIPPWGIDFSNPYPAEDVLIR